MEHAMRKNIRRIVEEMDAAYDAFASHNQMNGDYADFASMAVAEFRSALRNPDLTREELKSMFRSGIQAHRTEDENIGWSKFIAAHMTKTANTGI